MSASNNISTEKSKEKIQKEFRSGQVSVIRIIFSKLVIMSFLNQQQQNGFSNTVMAQIQ
ncbi:MAG TPA: hypothetical protein VF084_09455 [Nitrososphaeraceae archaeon]|jgi:hypothetical protein